MTTCHDDLTGGGICVRCGYSHLPEPRRRRILRLLPATYDDVREAWPCCYERTPAGQRRLNRDLNALGATYQRVGILRGMWAVKNLSE